MENNVVLDFSFKITKYGFNVPRERRMSSIPYQLILRNLMPTESYKTSNEFFINFKISLQTEQNDKFLKSMTINYLDLKIETNKEIISEVNLEKNLEKNKLYNIRWKNISSRIRNSSDNQSGEATANIEFANLLPVSINFQDNSIENERISNVDGFFNRLNILFQSIFATYTYIGPLREEPSRRYIYEDEIVEIGIKGENAAYIYLAEQDNVIKNSFFYEEAANSFFELKKPLKLSQALTNWLNFMKIKNLRPEPTNEIIYLNLNSSSADKTRVNIADVGFGVSQIFPIILEGLRMPKGNTLLLEQPEIHLHPNLQMQMADYFISLALSNKKVIVETHSDHIINRLVRRIVEDDQFNLKEMIGIYFIKPTENGSVYEEICIDDKRGITNWPIDFFDQTATEQEKIMQAGLKKRKAEREKRN